MVDTLLRPVVKEIFFGTDGVFIPHMLGRPRPKPAAKRDASPLRMLVVNTSPQLRLAFPEDEIAVTQTRLTQVPPADGERYGLIVAETPSEWERDGGRLRRLIETKAKSYVIIAPAPLLQQTAAEIRAVGRALRADPSRHRAADHALHASRSDQRPDDDFLHGFVQRRLLPFMKAYSESGGRDLYGVLMKQFERPVLEFALAQTDGNQVRAADLLGINRNTLRKRMRECGIGQSARKSRRRSR